MTADNSCRLQREAGHTHLDAVCQTFPRYPMNTARGVELTLSFSCPAVLNRASRQLPLAVVRSERQPLTIPADSYVLEVFPKQYSAQHPLFYYFEIEHHLIDILQCRYMTLKDRLQFLFDTVKEIGLLPKDEQIGQKLNAIFQRNYKLFDTIAVEAPENCSDADILIENFLVNFVFRKPFYVYGLARTAELLEGIWQQLIKARGCLGNTAAELEIARSIIMSIEFQYGHNRQALLAPKAGCGGR